MLHLTLRKPEYHHRDGQPLSRGGRILSGNETGEQRDIERRGKKRKGDTERDGEIQSGVKRGRERRKEAKR